MTYPPPQPPPQGPYQPPYPPPPGAYPGGLDYYGAQPSDPLTPARRASTLMYILGGIMLLFGACLGGMVGLLPELMKNPDFARTISQTPDFSQERLKFQWSVLCGFGLFFGLLMIVLAVFVRRGGRGAVVTGLVLASLVAIYLVLELFFVFSRASQLPPTALCGTACFLGLPLALFITLLVFLIQAVRGSDLVRATREQYAQQYWQYAYQQQMYQQQAQNPAHRPPVLQPPSRPQAPNYPPPPPPERPGNGPSGPKV